MKSILLIISIFVLNGCFYSFEDECIRPIIQVVSSNCWKNKGKDFPYVAYFQKKDQIGKTDTNTRWKDIKACGGINISRENNDFQIKNERDKNGIIDSEVIQKFEDCMLEKGYIRLYYIDCGTQYPKWDKGKCNL